MIDPSPGRGIGRRRLLQWTGVAVGAIGAEAIGVSTASACVRTRSKPPPIPDPIPIRQADSLVEAMGARINVQVADSSFGDLTSVRDAVAYIGLRYAREATVLPSINPTMAGHQANGWPMLAAAGCRILTIMGTADGKAGSVTAFADHHKSQFGGDSGGVLWGIENANEWNGRRGCGIGHGQSKVTGRFYSERYPLWNEQLALWQRRMWQVYSVDPHLEGLKVLGPSLVNATPGNSADLISVSEHVLGGQGLQPYLTHANYHVYPGQAAGLQEASAPSWHLDQKVAAMAVQAPDRPWICTESGMHNAYNDPIKAFSAHSASAAGIYAPRMTLEHLLRGTSKQFYFGLADDRPDPHRRNATVEFGLFTSDWSPKPAAVAWSRLVSLFADPGPAFTPEKVSTTVTGDPAMMLHSLRFQKRDGTTLLALWRDVSVYDYSTQSDLVVPPQTATVTLARPAAVTMYRPSVKAGVYRRLGNALTSMQVQLTGDVVILAVT
jgi:trimeric autotransporter adhesin